MLRNSIRNSQYRRLTTDLSMQPVGTPFSRQAQERQRKILLQQVVNLGEKAKDAKEILDIFMDGMEDLVLEAIKNADNPDRLMEIRAYYKACLALEGELTNMISRAANKEKVLEELKKRKGE